MTLDELVAGAGLDRLLGDATVEIADLAYDSRSVRPGTLFFCVPGATADGHDFAEAAVKAGAAGLVVQPEQESRLSGLGVPLAVAEDTRAVMAPVAAHFYGDPTAKLRVIGITGTNGKTTTAFLLREILETAGIRCGLLGTVKQIVAGGEEPVERTTPEAIDLQRTFSRMLAGGDEACAMEVSSHALALHRCDAIGFDVALFTNLTQDHLDFHGDMEEYFASKRILFQMSPGAAAVNVDDPYGRRLAAELEDAKSVPCLTFSAEGAEARVRAEEVTVGPGGAQFTVLGHFEGLNLAPISGRSPLADGLRLSTQLPGHFNVANALGAFAAALAIGAEPDVVAAGLGRAAPPPGRFEPIDEGQTFPVLVDYAHTPDSLANALRAAREMTAGRLIVVFGAGGDRDPGKRPLMGRAAAELADLVVVTSDNPRSEDPTAILEDILAGIAAGDKVEVETDRRAAIALGLASARSGDTVVIAGKGHEQGQEFEGGRKIPFDDREVARAELRRQSQGAPEQSPEET